MIRQFSTGRISRHLILAIVLCSSLVTVFTTAVQLYFDYRRDLFSIQDEMDRIEAVHLASLVESLWFVDGARIQTQIDGIQRLTNVEYVAVRDDESVSWTSGDRRSRQEITTEFPLVRRHPAGDKVIGVLEIVVSLDDVYSRLIDKVLVILATNAFKTFLVAGFMLVLFQYVVTRHLTKIAQFAHRETFEGTTEPLYLDRPQIRRWGEDELDDVAAAINDMRTNLRRSWEALRESEARFKDFANASADWFWEMGPDLRFTYHSERYFEITGFRPEEKIGTDRTRYVDPKDREADAEKWAAHLADLEAHRPFKNFEYSFTSSTSRACHARISGSPVFAQDGRFLGYRGTGTDITEHRRAEQALRENRDQMRLITDNLPFAISYLDNQRRYRFVNRTVETWFGRPAEEIFGHTIGDVLGQEADNAVTPQVAAALKGEEQHDERVIGYPDGKTRTVELIYVPDIDESETVRGCFALGQDITERKRAEEALRESEARLKRAQDIAQIGNFLWDAKRNEVIYRSEIIYDIYGLDPDVASRMFDESRLTAVHSDDRDRIREAYAVAATREPYDVEYRIIRSDGEIRHVREKNELEFDDTGTVVRSMGTFQDITELKRAEEQLRQSQKMEAVGQLTAGVAHDFNNMLAVTWGNAELLEDEIGADNPQLGAVFRATKRGADLTQRLLAFSRKQVLNPKIVNANNLIADITGLLRRTLEEHIDIETVTGAGLWNCEVDPAQLENALVNLAINARDAMPDGGKLTIETANVRLDDDYAAAQAEVRPGQYVMLAVTDTGTGMAPEVRDHVFEPFFTTKAVGKGSGLGLSMIYGFVKQSGGHVTIYSEPGEGTTIKLYLPRSTETEAAERKAATDAVPAARGETVLVVEDDSDLRTLAVALLGNLGYQVLEAGTGAAALEQLGSTTRVNLLLTDVMLPGGMNGRELAAEAGRRAPGLQVLYMSGYTENAIVHHGRLDADAELLPKPFRRADLARAVRRALDRPSA
jgi:PAS domain S-box-containing protein